MKRLTALRHEFVKFIPKELPEGVLYVSIPYATAIHNCACGCGSRVVTPLSPVDWTLIFDGRSVSLDPSIGNWDFPCRSHYWIRNNKVTWLRGFTETEIETVKDRDEHDSSKYYGGGDQVDPKPRPTKAKDRRKPKRKLKAWLDKWFGSNHSD